MGTSSQQNKHLVVLVHGFNKRSPDMQTLHSYLQGSHWSCFSVDLPTLFGDLDSCVQALSDSIANAIPSREAHPRLVVHFVAHSMGGLICRHIIQRYQQQTLDSRVHSSIEFGHCVFIATPHRGTRLANYANWIPLYHSIFKPLRALTTHQAYPRLPAPRQYKLGLIAGSASALPFGKFLAHPNDGRVEVSSVHSDDADDFIVLPYNHQRIHHTPACCQATEYFLHHGCFAQ